MPTFYRRSRMRKPSPLPSIIWLGRPLWLRVLRAIVRPLVLAHLHAQLASASRLLADQDQTLAGLRAELARLTTLRSAPAPAVLPSPVPRPPEPTADLERQRVALRQLCILVAIQARQVEPLTGCRAMGLSPAAADRFRETAVATGVRAAQTMPPKGAP